MGRATAARAAAKFALVLLGGSFLGGGGQGGAFVGGDLDGDLVGLCPGTKLWCWPEL